MKPGQKWFFAVSGGVRPRTLHLTRIFGTGIKNGESQRDSASKPWVARNELPWVLSARIPQLRRSCARRPSNVMPQFLSAKVWDQGAANSDTTPMGLVTFCGRGPRVARSSQPWAGGHNPFGIGNAYKVQRGRAHSVLPSPRVTRQPHAPLHRRLEFGASLERGAWSLVLRSRAFHRKPRRTHVPPDRPLAPVTYED